MTDTRTGRVVWGSEPTEEEIAIHEETMLAQREEWLDELAYLQGEGERYDRLEADRRVAEAKAERELLEDILYITQDEMMGHRVRG